MAAAESLYCVDFVSAEVCKAINRGAGISGIPVDPNPADTVVIWPGITGGPETFCYQWNPGKYSYCQVLVAN